MKVCGIIAEYNPFHSGHAYQIEQARKQSGCDFMIAIMSGDFVQRGAPALTDKYIRARQALYEGADLVLMLPVYGSTASAEGFARTGIAALLSTGVVDAISFGCEDLSVCSDNYRRLSKTLAHEHEGFQTALTEHLSAGIPYAQARVAAVRSCYGGEFDLTLLDSPNNLLAFEYMRALERFRADMDLIPIKRRGSYHDTNVLPTNSASDDSNDTASTSCAKNAPPIGITFASASACRKSLLEDPGSKLPILEQARQIPAEVCRLLADYAKSYCFLQEDDLSLPLHYALLTQKSGGFEHFLDCGRDLSARIVNQMDAYESFSRFCDLLKNKSVTRARIARTLTHILLQLPAQMPAPLISEEGTLPYLRVLGFRQSSAPLLHEIKLRAQSSLITRVSEAAQLLSAESLQYFRQDLFAGEIYRSILLNKCGHCYPDDYRRKIEII